MNKPFFLKWICVSMIMFFFQCSAFAKDYENISKIKTVGSAELKVKPDIAHINLIVEANESIKEDAKSMVDEIVSDVYQEALNLNLKKTNIDASNFELYPNYFYPKNKPKRFEGYIAKRKVQIDLNNLAILNTLMDRLLKLKNLKISNINFGVKEPKKYKDRVQNMAIKNAIKNAKTIAKGFHYKLEKVLEINYLDNNNIAPVLYRMAGSFRNDSAVDRSYIAREVEFKDSVSVIYQIKPT